MTSVFDKILEKIRQGGYHNHRRETHSDIISNQIVADLSATCQPFAKDLQSGAIRVWQKTKGPDDRTTDLLAGPPDVNGDPIIPEVRLLVEHKSVITAHRNRNARYQDIDRERLSAHRTNPKIIVGATVLIGTCERVLNIPDCVAKFQDEQTFRDKILPRLSTGDQDLWQEFPKCVSVNKPKDAAATVQLFKSLPVRTTADTHLSALDYLLMAPVKIDNVNPPELDPRLGIDPAQDYERMIRHFCRLYNLRWHDTR